MLPWTLLIVIKQRVAENVFVMSLVLTIVYGGGVSHVLYYIHLLLSYMGESVRCMVLLRIAI